MGKGGECLGSGQQSEDTSSVLKFQRHQPNAHTHRHKRLFWFFLFDDFYLPHVVYFILQGCG